MKASATQYTFMASTRPTSIAGQLSSATSIGAAPIRAIVEAILTISHTMNPAAAVPAFRDEKRPVSPRAKMAAGITTAETERLVAIIRQINRIATLIVVDHDMHFVRMLDARITVFHQGAILVEGDADKVLTDPSVREVYLGSRAR